MGVSGSASREKTNSEFERSGNVNVNYTDPRAQSGLNALEALARGGGGNPATKQLESFYLSRIGGGNPNLDNMISANDQVANTDFNNRLAQVRSGGFRGGGARDVINQAGLASDFTNRRAADNARLRFDDFNARGNDAQGLMSLLFGGQQQQGSSATALLNALRGQKTDERGTSSSTTTSMSAGGSASI